MKIKVEELGPLYHGQLELNDLTIVCGENNIGKTYLTYAIYGFLKNWKSFMHVRLSQTSFSQLMESGSVEIDLEAEYIDSFQKRLREACKGYKGQLSAALGSTQNKFENTFVGFEVEQSDRLYSSRFARTYRSGGGKAIITVEKPKNSYKLTFTAVKSGEDEYSHFSTNIYDDILAEVLYGHSIPRPFIVSSERTGVMTFRSELNLTKNRLVEFLHNAKAGETPFSAFNILQTMLTTGYPLPVSDNIDFINRLEKIEGNQGQLALENPALVEAVESLVGGTYRREKDGEVSITMRKSRQRLRMGESSSSVRSLVILAYYIKHVAAKNDLLIIDEPELNLHPRNQRKLARLIAQFVNCGLKVFVTTHSDYIIKEINSLIMLNNRVDGVDAVAAQFGYTEKETLKHDKVSVFMIMNGLVKTKKNSRAVRANHIQQAPIDPLYGIELQTFDQEIDQMNEIQSSLVDLFVTQGRLPE